MEGWWGFCVSRRGVYGSEGQYDGMTDVPEYEPPEPECERVTWPPVTAQTLHDRYCALTRLAHLVPDGAEDTHCGGDPES